jgi:hypothetical protein
LEHELWTVIENNFDTFSGKIDTELSSLPDTQEKIYQLYAWMAVLKYRISIAKKNSPSSRGESRLKALKKLREKLVEIRKQTLIKVNTTPENGEKDRVLSLKQGLLLLRELKIMELPDIKKLPTTKQAELFSALLGFSYNTTRRLLTNIDKKEQNPDDTIFKRENINRVNDLLEKADLQKYMSRE